MFLRYRPARLADLPECLGCIRDQFAFDAADRVDLLAMWRELLQSEAANATIIQDTDLPPGRQICNFCVIVFISPEYAAYLKTEAPPLLGRLVLESWRKGQPPWLSAAEVRRANSDGGVTMLTLHSGPKPEILHSPRIQWFATKITDYTPWAISGYHLQELLVEMYIPTEYTYAEEFGLTLGRDHGEYDGPETARGGDCARLYHLTREQAIKQVGTAVAELFHSQPPRFFFKPAEQMLLWCSLHGDTDEELAEWLALAPVTVKKRWRNIYERIAAVDPSLLGGTGTERQRGSEKKRRLLHYLRHHMEELRPVVRPK